MTVDMSPSSGGSGPNSVVSGNTPLNSIFTNSNLSKSSGDSAPAVISGPSIFEYSLVNLSLKMSKVSSDIVLSDDSVSANPY